MPKVTFALQPSIGTWLRCRLRSRRALEHVNYLGPCFVKPNEEVAGLNVPFAQKPSVATWLQWQVDAVADTDNVGLGCVDEASSNAVFLANAALVDGETVKLIEAQAVPWEADFEADFKGASVVATHAPTTVVSSVPSMRLAQPMCTSSSTSSSILFSLAPPPKPVGSISVGTSTSAAKLVCIDDLPLAKKIVESEISVPRKPKPTDKEINCMGTVYHDDEESLLDGACEDLSVGSAHRSRVLYDVDSASESEDGEGSSRNAIRPRPNHARTGPGVVGSGSVVATVRTSTDGALANSAPNDCAVATEDGHRSPNTNTLAADKAIVSTADEASRGLDGKMDSNVKPFCNSSACRSPSDGISVVTTGARRVSRFLVRVPSPHPGMWYRKSKLLNDTHDHYAEDGTTVIGYVEDDEWLHISDSLFLPIRVGGVELLHALPQEPPAKESRSNVDSIWSFWAWCSGCQGDHTPCDIDVNVSMDVFSQTQVGLSTDSQPLYSGGDDRRQDGVMTH